MFSEERDDEYEERLGAKRTREGCGEREASSSEACPGLVIRAPWQLGAAKEELLLPSCQAEASVPRRVQAWPAGEDIVSLCGFAFVFLAFFFLE